MPLQLPCPQSPVLRAGIALQLQCVLHGLADMLVVTIAARPDWRVRRPGGTQVGLDTYTIHNVLPTFTNGGASGSILVEGAAHRIKWHASRHEREKHVSVNKVTSDIRQLQDLDADMHTRAIEHYDIVHSC